MPKNVSYTRIEAAHVVDGIIRKMAGSARLFIVDSKTTHIAEVLAAENVLYWIEAAERVLNNIKE